MHSYKDEGKLFHSASLVLPMKIIFYNFVLKILLSTIFVYVMRKKCSKAGKKIFFSNPIYVTDVLDFVEGYLSSIKLLPIIHKGLVK